MTFFVYFDILLRIIRGDASNCYISSTSRSRSPVPLKVNDKKKRVSKLENKKSNGNGNNNGNGNGKGKGKLLVFMRKYPNIIAIIISSLVSTLLAFTIRYLYLSYYGIDLFFVTETPYLSLIGMFSINTIRLVIRFYIENILNGSITLKMDVPSMLNPEDFFPYPPKPGGSVPGNSQGGGSVPSNSQGGGNVPGNSQGGNVPGNSQGGNVPDNLEGGPLTLHEGKIYPSFRCKDGVYTIVDLYSIGDRGYINPDTGSPYPRSQPYAINLSYAMQDDANRWGRATAFNERAFDSKSQKFYEEFMSYNYPNRNRNTWWNSGPVRKALSKIP